MPNDSIPSPGKRPLPLLGLLAAVALGAAPAHAACDGVDYLIALSKSASKSLVAPGESVTFTYQLANLAGMPLDNVTITDDNGTPANPADDVVVATVPFLDAAQTLSFTWTTAMPSVPGSYTNVACAFTVLFGSLPLAASASAVVTVEAAAPPPPTNPGVLGQGYWKNHPDEWPLAAVQLGAGSFSQLEALALLMTPPAQGDKSRNLVHQLIAAKLNVAAGNDSACVQEAIADADDFLTLFPVGQPVKANSAAWKAVAPAFEVLGAYNEGLLCVPAQP